MKIYTKTGDLGITGLYGGARVPKHHLRIDAYGTVDELNSHIGLVRDLATHSEPIRTFLRQIQDRLFTLGAHLASDPSKQMIVPDLLETDLTALEEAMDEMDAELPELRNFILPGGHIAVSQCHVARCVCRRAERLTVALAAEEVVEEIVIRYLNRLSDYLFVLCRQLSKDLGAEEVAWKTR